VDELRDIWLGDLLRCVDELGPLDEAQTASVARMLGFTWDMPRAQPGGDPADPGEPDDEPDDTIWDFEPQGGSDVVGPAAQETALGESARRRLEPVGRVEHAYSRPWQDADTLEDYIPDVHGRELPHTPLWEPRWTRQLVAAAAATSAVGHAVDIPRAVDVVARARPLLDVPRVARRTLARGVQVLMDMGDGMAPYARDRAQLVREIAPVAGKDRTAILLFRGSPLRDVRVRGRRSRHEYRPPEHGTPVLALTDLAIGDPDRARRAEDRADWVQLARSLAQRGSQLIALVPYPPERWPSALADAMTVLQWDRPATVAGVLHGVMAAERR
jgi:hypothetical protein